jgi:hypothetical protein
MSYTDVPVDERTRRRLQELQDADAQRNGGRLQTIRQPAIVNTPTPSYAFQGSYQGSMAIDPGRYAGYRPSRFESEDFLNSISRHTTVHVACPQCKWQRDFIDSDDVNGKARGKIMLDRHMEEAHSITAGVDTGDRLDAFLQRLPVKQEQKKWGNTDEKNLC